MTPEEQKVDELLDKFGTQKGFIISFQDAIRLSLICVDEIINAIDWHPHETPNIELSFWINVQEGLIKLQEITVKPLFSSRGYKALFVFLVIDVFFNSFY